MYTHTVPNQAPVVVTSVLSIVRGEARCLADAWGYSHPVPSTSVFVFDRRTQGPASNSLLAGDATNLDGSFDITVPADLRSIPWALEFFNDFTNERFTRNSSSIVGIPQVKPLPRGMSQIEVRAGQTFVPWNPLLPPLARVGNREYVYHMDVARALASGLKQQSSAVFLEEFDPPSSSRNAELDDIFTALEMASTGGAADPTGRIAGEVSRLLNIPFAKIRSPEDVFRLALEHIAGLSIHQVYRQDIGTKLGKVIAQAVGAPSWPMGPFRGQGPELAAACVLLYVAGHVAGGRKVRMRLSGSAVQTFPGQSRHFLETEATIS